MIHRVIKEGLLPFFYYEINELVISDKTDMSILWKINNDKKIYIHVLKYTYIYATI